MQLSTGKLSNYVGQLKENKKVDSYLLSVDKDLQNLWISINSVMHLVGSQKSVLDSNATLGFSYIPLINSNPTGTPTNYEGHTAVCFCNSNSSLYIFNTSDNNWKVELLS